MPFHRRRCYPFTVRVIVNFQHRKGWNIHTIAEDCRTTLGPYKDVSSETILLRLFRYLGATDDAMEEAMNDIRRWSRGGIHIDVPEDRWHLLGITDSRRAKRVTERAGT